MLLVVANKAYPVKRMQNRKKDSDVSSKQGLVKALLYRHSFT